jgi:hypothetical protein
MTNGQGEQRRTATDTEPQASQATRQARHEANWLWDEEVTKGLTTNADHNRVRIKRTSAHV